MSSSCVTRFGQLGFVMLAALALAGCAFGTTRIEVTSDPLAPVASTQSGRLLVRQFADHREGKAADIQGNKRNGFGMVLGNIGLPEGQTVAGVVTERFAEAIRHAGYDVTVDSTGQDGASGFDAVVEGDIKKFWLDFYMAVWHDVDVDLRIVDPRSGTAHWSGTIRGNETNALWLGASGEFKRVIREALTKALDQTAAMFASAEVAATVAKCRSGAP